MDERDKSKIQSNLTLLVSKTAWNPKLETALQGTKVFKNNVFIEKIKVSS